VLLGSTRDEFRPAVAQLGLGFPLPLASYAPALTSVFGEARAARVLAEYPAADYQDPAFALGAALTDATVACPSDALRAALARRARVFGYEFADGEAPAGKLTGLLTGAFHTSELQYFFALQPSPGVLNDSQQRLSDQMMRYWAAFARDGDPAVSGQVRWSAFTRSAPRVLSLETGTPRLIDGFRSAHHCEFWQTLE
jgi:para-nitrobenzyl esterase